MVEFKEALLKKVNDLVEKTLEQSVEGIVLELPEGRASSIAEDIFVEKESENVYNVIITSPVWSYLNYGRGIYSPEGKHRGAGPNGEIVPVSATIGGHVQSLHFKNATIAQALGFPTEDVFLKSVKGITPRWFFQRWFSPTKLNATFQQVKRTNP